MASYSLVFIILLLFVINVDSGRLSKERRIRQFWQKITEKLKEQTVNKFHIDIRHFDKEEMILFPDVAFQSTDDDTTWKIMIHGWRYEGNRGRDWFGYSTSQWVERLAKSIMNPDDILYLNGSLDRNRLKPFFVEDEADELITIKIGEKIHTLQTDKHGQFYEQIVVTNNEIQKLKQQQKTNDRITYEAAGDNQDKATGTIRLLFYLRAKILIE